jgi:hypothetical protein
MINWAAFVPFEADEHSFPRCHVRYELGITPRLQFGRGRLPRN